jgi:sigma-B regulation protein RsbU (phosphoserine phosphatase)
VVAQTGLDDPERAALVEAVAVASLERRGELLVHAGQQVPGSRLVAAEPALGVPVQLQGTAVQERPPGVLVLVGHGSGRRFSAGEAQLAATVARQLAVGLENGRLVLALRDKERLEHELGLAAGIQAQLLAGAVPAMPGASLRAVCRPAEHVGGDYYDFVRSEDGSVTTVVADVTGHGVGPALIMAMTRSVLRAEFGSSSSLPDALTATNATMWDDLLATGLFITVFALTFDPASRRVRFVNGGHHPALLRHPDGQVDELDSDGMPIGLLPDPGYEDGETALEPGSVLLVFSDGVVETRAPDGQFFGTPRLIDFLAEHGERPDLVDRLLADLEDHRAGAAQQDDVTVVELRTQRQHPVCPVGQP